MTNSAFIADLERLEDEIDGALLHCPNENSQMFIELRRRQSRLKEEIERFRHEVLGKQQLHLRSPNQNPIETATGRLVDEAIYQCQCHRQCHERRPHMAAWQGMSYGGQQRKGEQHQPGVHPDSSSRPGHDRQSTSPNFAELHGCATVVPHP